MGKIGAVQDKMEEEYNDSFCAEISHTTDGVNAVVQSADI